jgi:hypothetical protein
MSRLKEGAAFAFFDDSLSSFHYFFSTKSLTMARQYQTSALSRERNRVHARKTRQRKKEQMQTLQGKADELKEEQTRLKQTINEKNTASILCCLFSKDCSSDQRVEDPVVEELLRRPVDEIPDASQLPELPALILPGQHNSKKHRDSDLIIIQQELPDDGIDYELLGKDRAKCTPAELDRIRRERNRMHAKRTRDRKRLFMEEMADMCKKLEDENILLQRHLDGLNGVKPSSQPLQVSQRPVISPSLSATPAQHTPPPLGGSGCTAPTSSLDNCASSKTPVSRHGVTSDQIKTLLEAAGAFSSTLSASAISASTDASEGGSLSDHDDNSSCKRRRLNGSQDVSTIVATSVPKSITTSSATGC